MLNPTTIELIGAALFLTAIIHTFSTKYFEHLAHSNPKYAGLLHFLGEIEVVFGFWAMILVLFMFLIDGKNQAVDFVQSRNFTEPMFVFVIMVIAGTRPILIYSEKIVLFFSRLLPIKKEVAIYALLLSLVPLLGSFITEPAAMTLAAMLLGRNYFGKEVSNKFKYATLGVLFVNISIGGTLTPFAAPPVLMVSNTWNWDLWFMISNFGWRSAIAVVINTIGIVFIFKENLNKVTFKASNKDNMPFPIIFIHLVFYLESYISPIMLHSLCLSFCFFLGLPLPIKSIKMNSF